MSVELRKEAQNREPALRATPAASPSPYLITLALFIVALAPRLPGLSLFLTSDENTNIFLAGSDVISAFLQGDWRGTYWHFYPGVTMSWLDAVGMAGQYLLDTLAGRSVPPFTDYIYSDILSLIVANRVPYAILTAAAVPALYLLARQLIPGRMAVLGAFFLAFDPFYLAHSRVAHGDAPVAVFMCLSALAFFVYGERTGESTIVVHRSSFYLFLSAIFGSLAALTKAPGQFMAIFIVGLSIVYAGLELRQASHNRRHSIRHTTHLAHVIIRWTTVVAVWGLVSLAVFFLLWPSMWVDPIGTFRQMWDETFGKVNEGHLVYFLGQPTLNPGPWFYLYVIPFRMTPIILIGSLLSLLWFVPNLNSKLNLQNSKLNPIFLFWLFTITLLLFGNLSPKKQDRYLLPLFPVLNLLAAIGWLGLIELFYHALAPKLSIAPQQATRIRTLGRQRLLSLIPKGHFVSKLLILILLLFHFMPTFTYYPYYLTYFNPLLGGPTQAAKTTLMGWGEGMEQAAAYLNTKPNADTLYVASTPSQTLLPYFAGAGENFYTNDIAFRADYVVLYLAQMQRRAPSPEIVDYFQARQPEKIITIKNVPYVKIYPGPKFILPDIPPEAIPANIGLDNAIRLAGYKISTLHAPNPQLILYWHALAPISVDYTISVRARAADDRLLAQQDSWPVDGLLPTSQWRQGDYVIDAHSLEIAEVDANQINKLEIVVYNFETGDTLGPPITVSLDNEQ